MQNVSYNLLSTTMMVQHERGPTEMRCLEIAVYILWLHTKSQRKIGYSSRLILLLVSSVRTCVLLVSNS
jgi:hypothetical protein